MAEERGSDDRMSDVDKILWVIEANPQLRSTITAVLFFDQAPDRASLSTRVERATRRVPRLRQRVVSNPYSLAPPRWELDPTFNLSYHLRWSHLGGIGTRTDVLSLAEPIAMQSFDKARPLWEFTVVEGLVEHASAMIAKVHHTITDGVGGIELMLELLDLEREPATTADMPTTPVGRVLNQKERFRDALAHELQRRRDTTKLAAEGLADLARDPIEGIRRSIDTAASALRMAQPSTRPMSPLLEARSLSVQFHTIDRPLAAFRAAAKATDASLNDIYVTGLCRGLLRWHLQHDMPLSALRMGMPISSRRDGKNGATTASANQFLPTRFEVPLAIDDAREHVAAVHALIQAERHRPALELVEPLAAVLSRLPRFALTNLFATVLRGQDFLASNVAGAPIPVFLSGARMTAMIAFGPLSGTALNLTLLSYHDTVYIGINHDPDAISDGDALTQCLAVGIDEVLALGAPAKAPKAPKAPTKAKRKAASAVPKTRR